MPVIRAVLPKDRNLAGRLWVEDNNGNVIAGPVDAIGQADRTTAKERKNPQRDPLLPYGNTPLGTYVVAGFRAPENDNKAYRLGPYNRIELIPIGGEALTAAENGRDSLQIHGGHLNGQGNMRPTNGCVRLRNEDMAIILDAITTAGAPPNRCEFLEGDALVEVYDPSAEGLPPGRPDGDPNNPADALRVPEILTSMSGPDEGADDGDPPRCSSPLTPMPTGVYSPPSRVAPSGSPPPRGMDDRIDDHGTHGPHTGGSDHPDKDKTGDHPDKDKSSGHPDKDKSSGHPDKDGPPTLRT